MFDFGDDDELTVSDLAALAPTAASLADPAAVAEQGSVGDGERWPEPSGPPPLAGYRQRWAVNIHDWKPVGEVAGAEFQFLLGLIPEEAERRQVTRYKFYDDNKRALVSRLLIRQASLAALGLPSFKDITVKRTKGKKPYLASPLTPESEAPNWNVNVSHEGAWVICASEPLCLVGCDVAELRRLKPNGDAIDFYTVFKDMLTNREWATVRAGGPTLDDQYETFARFWSAKEAFVKARGDGLGFPLGKAEFAWNPLAGAGAPERPTAYEGTVRVEGAEAPQWRFVQHRMPGAVPHWSTVARGPPTAAVDAFGEFTSTLRQPRLAASPEEWQAALLAPCPGFDVLPVGALVPQDDMDAFVAAGGARWPPQQAQTDR